jgi:hypothetical protein
MCTHNRNTIDHVRTGIVLVGTAVRRPARVTLIQSAQKSAPGQGSLLRLRNLDGATLGQR